MNYFRILAVLATVCFMLQIIHCNISSPVIAVDEYGNSFAVDDRTQLFWALNTTARTLEIAVRATNVTGFVALSFNYKDNSFVLQVFLQYICLIFLSWHERC